MDQQQLSDRLEDRVADVPVGAAPIDAMRSAVRRRRSRMTVLAAATAVVLVVGGGLVIQTLDTSSDPQPPVAADPPADSDLPPDGYRYVGIGAAVVAVPETWGTNEIECGTPVKDTAVIDLGAICAMLVPRPVDVDSVEVRAAFEDVDVARGFSEIDIDGIRAYWSPVESEGGVASASVYVPAYDAIFLAQSSSADAVAAVERMLDGITVLERHTTVPGFNDLAYDQDPAPATQSYIARLDGLRLTAELIEKASPMEAGTVLATEPGVGSVVAPGDTITVTVAR